MKKQMLFLIPGAALAALSLASCWEVREVALAWEALAAKSWTLPTAAVDFPRDGDDDAPEILSRR
jgi:hypothetical protein